MRSRLAVPLLAASATALRAGSPQMVQGGLGSVLLTPLTAGQPSGEPVAASELWRENGAVIFAVRRPG